jgi:membrane-associated HD superfamily phosphohydrolase
MSFFIMNKKIINKILFIVIFYSLLYTSVAKAQPPSNEKMRALVIGYITKELDLTSEEAQKFWPIYNQYETEIKEARKQQKEELDLEEDVLKIRRSYKVKFKTAGISEQKVDKLFKAEKKLIHHIRQNIAKRKLIQQNGGGQQPKRPLKRRA